VLACVLVAAFLYTEPVYSPIVLIDVAHPGAKADLIQPIPVPQPPATSGLHPAPSPATPPVAASTTATFGPGSISRPATPPATASSTTSRAPISRPAPPAPPQSDTAAFNPPGPATVAGFGSLSINARPWADIWIDGQSAGQTPIANLQLTLGTHEVLFRHPQLGERRRTVQVSNVAPTRISVDLRD
jgi:serine/threonine-protein kinase